VISTAHLALNAGVFRVVTMMRILTPSALTILGRAVLMVNWVLVIEAIAYTRSHPFRDQIVGQQAKEYHIFALIVR
jgi:hypothetical protein